MPFAALLVDGNPSAAEVLRLVLESMPCGMMTTDSQGQITLVNSQTEKMFGYRREELLGRSTDMLIPERFVDQHHLSHRRYFAQPACRPMGAGRELYGLRRDG